MPEGVVEGARDSTRRKFDGVADILLARFLRVKRQFLLNAFTITKPRVRRPLHHGSLAARAPVVPLPASRGRKVAALSQARIAAGEIDWQMIERFLYSLRSIRSSLIPFSQFVISSLKKLRGRSADRRHCLVPRHARRVLPCALRSGRRRAIRARSPTGAPPRHLRQRTNATAQLQPALPGTRRHQVLPASGLSIQSSELPRSTGRSAGRAYPPKPPGSGLRSRPREPHSLRFRDRLEKRPHTSEPLSP